MTDSDSLEYKVSRRLISPGKCCNPKVNTLTLPCWHQIHFIKKKLDRTCNKEMAFDCEIKRKNYKVYPTSSKIYHLVASKALLELD